MAERFIPNSYPSLTKLMKDRSLNGSSIDEETTPININPEEVGSEESFQKHSALGKQAGLLSEPEEPIEPPAIDPITDILVPIGIAGTVGKVAKAGVNAAVDALESNVGRKITSELGKFATDEFGAVKLPQQAMLDRIKAAASKPAVETGAEIEKIADKGKEFGAEIHWPDGTVTPTSAKKSGQTWMIGGDHARATTENGGKIFIRSGDGIYHLKGSRMVFQDNAREGEMLVPSKLEQPPVISDVKSIASGKTPITTNKEVQLSDKLYDKRELLKNEQGSIAQKMDELDQKMRQSVKRGEPFEVRRKLIDEKNKLIDSDNSLQEQIDEVHRKLTPSRARLSELSKEASDAHPGVEKIRYDAIGGEDGNPVEVIYKPGYEWDGRSYETFETVKDALNAIKSGKLNPKKVGE